MEQADSGVGGAIWFGILPHLLGLHVDLVCLDIRQPDQWCPSVSPAVKTRSPKTYLWHQGARLAATFSLLPSVVVANISFQFSLETILENPRLKHPTLKMLGETLSCGLYYFTLVSEQRI